MQIKVANDLEFSKSWVYSSELGFLTKDGTFVKNFWAYEDDHTNFKTTREAIGALKRAVTSLKLVEKGRKSGFYSHIFETSSLY